MSYSGKQLRLALLLALTATGGLVLWSSTSTIHSAAAASAASTSTRTTPSTVPASASAAEDGQPDGVETPSSLTSRLPPVAPETERLFLSGSNLGDTKLWNFSIDEGERAGEQSTIEVPSQWEQQGFGRYSYGREKNKLAEVGLYETTFRLAPSWLDRNLRLVFGGVMTDAHVTLNGESLGLHQGGFTEFDFDISSHVKATNTLEVRVAEASSDKSINRAERDADYWVFGGIYRPVWIEARPQSHIAHVAVRAEHSGLFEAHVETRNASGCQLEARATTTTGQPVLEIHSAVDDEGTTVLATQAKDPLQWTAETPNLHRLDVVLSCNDLPVHTETTRFGFRTVEVRPGEGLFINGQRTVLRGINRHSFWPDTGRTVTREQNRRDAELLKSLHFNAVRASHYPPDRAFLEACDEIGLYVLDELPGWQDAYSTEAGTPLVRELVRRDVNHPSVIAWNNGNEDGWNTSLDPLFLEHDPQNRIVLHPRGRFGGFETEHYPDWKELQKLIREDTDLLLMPTEFLHGLYDGGGGASLADYWTAMSTTSRFAGGFLWAFLDEAVQRRDTEELDAWTNFAPDGIVGPYRELEPSARTVRQLFAPVQFGDLERLDENLEVSVQNNFHHTDLNQVVFQWHWLGLRGVRPTGDPISRPLGTAQAAPGGADRLLLPPGPAEPGLLTVSASLDGREVGHRSWPVQGNVAPVTEPDPSQGPRVDEDEHTVTLRRGDLAAVFSRANGALIRLEAAGESLDLNIGSKALGGDEAELLGYETTSSSTNRARIRFGFQGAVQTATWTLEATGDLHANLLLVTSRDQEIVGVQLLPEGTNLERMAWFGRGPTPVWRNRMEGPDWGLWSQNPQTDSHGRGFFGPFLSAQIDLGAPADTAAGRTTSLRVGSRKMRTYLGVLAPHIPDDAKEATAETTSGLTLLTHISAIGTKFHNPAALGPDGARQSPAGLHQIEFSLGLGPSSVAPELQTTQRP